ncbi:MAG: para-aminobenzoate synthetase component 1 [Nonlabens sp.]|jgi:para-aminobenzoate synthetase component 1
MATINFPYQGFSKEEFIIKALTWADTQSHFAYFNSNDIPYPKNGFRHILAIGANEKLDCHARSVFDDLRAFHKKIEQSDQMNDWLVGYLGYDLKNETERLESNNHDLLEFPETQFFNPEHVLLFHEDKAEMLSTQIDLIDTIISVNVSHTKNQLSRPTNSVAKADYLTNVEHLRKHIEEGDCYEINYCQEFHGEVNMFNPVELYQSLNEISPNPFSCLQKFNDDYIVSASPERFMKQNGSTIVSQPIKGTRQRSENANEDIRLKTDLRNDPKELAENMMIVDLVRNDLARTAKTGTVKVEEIFGIYSFPQVHQMISTITSEKRDGVHPIDAIEKAFPMGSMTGAPKVKVMELIEQYENTKRGPFSGAAGFFNGSESFDFNVLIRSIFINKKTNTYSFQVGGAITYDSVPEKEYEECMVKAKAIFQLIGINEKP